MSSWMKSDTSISIKLGVEAVIIWDFKIIPVQFQKMSLSLVLLSDNAVFARTCNGKIFDVASDFGIEELFGPWYCWIGKSSNGSEDCSVVSHELESSQGLLYSFMFQCHYHCHTVSLLQSILRRDFTFKMI